MESLGSEPLCSNVTQSIPAPVHRRPKPQLKRGSDLAKVIKSIRKQSFCGLGLSFFSCSYSAMILERQNPQLQDQRGQISGIVQRSSTRLDQ